MLPRYIRLLAVFLILAGGAALWATGSGDRDPSATAAADGDEPSVAGGEATTEGPEPVRELKTVYILPVQDQIV